MIKMRMRRSEKKKRTHGRVSAAKASALACSQQLLASFNLLYIARH